MTVTTLVSIGFSQGRFPVSAGQYLANLTMLNSLPNIENVDVVYWTLWAELRFYAMIFVLTLIGITRRRVIVFLWTWLAATFVFEAGLLPDATDLLLNTQFSHYFIAGMALCLIYRFAPGPGPQSILILLIALGNESPAPSDSRTASASATAQKSTARQSSPSSSRSSPSCS